MRLSEHLDEIVDLYTKDKLSTTVIAKKYGVTSTEIVRALRKAGVPSRTRSEAAKVGYESGRMTPSMLGKKHPEETKRKISNSVTNLWANMSEEDKDKIVAKHKENWANMSDEERATLFYKAHVSIAEAAKNGSKLEKFILEKLRENGVECYPHLNILENAKLEIDIALPTRKIAIELDGPNHFSAEIWGEESLRKTRASDSEKNGLLIANGYKVIRVQYTKKHSSKFFMYQTLDELLKTIGLCESTPETLFVITI